MKGQAELFTNSRYITVFKAALVAMITVLLVFSPLALALPDTVTLTVDRSGTPYTFQLERASVRTADCKVYTWDATNGYQEVNPLPEVRTYRGTVDEDSNTLILAWIKTDGTLFYSGFNPEWGKGWYWEGTSYDVSSQLVTPIEPTILPQTTGTGASFSRTVAAGIDAPHSYFPPSGGMRICEMVMDMRNADYTKYGNVDDAQGYLEYYTMTYSFTNARDTLVETQLAASCLNLDSYYSTVGGTSLQNLRARWNVGPNILATNHSDYDMAHLTNSIWAAWVNTAGGAWGCSGGAVYHEGSHNWGAGHLAYERDSQWGNRPFNGAWNIDKILKRRSDVIAKFPARTTDYPWPLHPYTHPDLVSTPVNTSIDINVLANDWDGNDDDLSVVSFTTSDGTVQDMGNGVLRYTPSTDYVGKAMIVYTIEDNSPLTLRSRDIVHVEVVNQSLAVHYEFEEISGTTVFDSSGVGYNGLLTDGGDFSTDSVSGPVGNGVRARGGMQPQGGNYTGIIVGSGSILPVATTNWNGSPFDPEFNDDSGFYDPMGESYSLACWFKADSFASGDVEIASKQGFPEKLVGYRLLASAGGLTFWINSFDGAQDKWSIAGPATLSDDTWYHAAVVIDRSTDDIRLYLNGNLVGENTTGLVPGHFIFNGRAPLRLGESSSNRLCVDDFRVYTRVLTQPEVLGLFDLGDGVQFAVTPRQVSFTAAYGVAAGNTTDLTLHNNGAAASNWTATQSATWFDLSATSGTISARGSEVVALTLNAEADALAPGTHTATVEFTDTTNGIVKECEVTLTVLPPTPLRGYWNLDETSGTTAGDLSTFGNNGTLNNFTFDSDSVPGQFGNALQFDGINNYVNLGDPGSLKITGEITMAAWVKADATSGLHSILAKGYSASPNGENVLRISSNRYQVGSWNGTNHMVTLAGADLDIGQWVHLAGTYDGTAWRLYKNGVLAATATDSTGAVLVNDSWRIGAGSDGRYFDGVIDDVRLYDYALDAAAIAVLFKGGGAESPTPFDGKAGVNVPRLSWVPGAAATEYDVYVGTNATAVAIATKASAEYAGTTTATEFDPTLNTLTQYYWRIDTVIASQTLTGGVWTFTTANQMYEPYLISQWKLDDGTGTTAVDATGNGYNGTITGATWVSGEDGGALDFTAANSDTVDIPASTFETVSDAISVALWVNGDAAIQPNSNSVLYARDASGYRVLNIHLPWSDSSVYWDAGNSGTVSYDRINKVATEAEFEGQWNHWVFTKDTVSGEMKIYLNGVLWHSGTGKTRTIGGITSASIGSLLGTGNFYDGAIDDVQIYNAALNDTEVSDLYNSYSLDTGPPEFTSDPIVKADAVEDTAYSGQSLAGDASDPDAGDTLTFSKISGSDWLTIAASGDLSGTPDDSHVGLNSFSVRVTDSGGLSDSATLNITVQNLYDGQWGLSDFAGFSASWQNTNCGLCGGADLDGDNDVTLNDLRIFGENWLALGNDNLVGHWPLDTDASDSVSGHDGTLRNGASIDNGDPAVGAGAVALDGVNDYVEMTGYKGVTDTASRTCTAWVKTSTSLYSSIITWGDNQAGKQWLFRVDYNGALGLGVGSGYARTTQTVNDNTWHHVAVVMEDDGTPNVNEVKFYIDGVLQTGVTGNAYPINTGSVENVIVGAESNSGLLLNMFPGQIDDVRIYDTALDSASIVSLAGL